MKTERIRADIAFVKQQAEELLRTGTEEAYQALGQIVDMEYVKALSDGDTELKIMKLLVEIYRMEQEEGYEQTILSKGRDLRSLLEIYYKILFYLQRIWFEIEEAEQKIIISFVEEKQISSCAVYMILQDSRITDKEIVWEKVIRLWEKHYE